MHLTCVLAATATTLCSPLVPSSMAVKALAKSSEMEPVPARPQRVGADEDIVVRCAIFFSTDAVCCCAECIHIGERVVFSCGVRLGVKANDDCSEVISRAWRYDEHTCVKIVFGKSKDTEFLRDICLLLGLT